MSTGRAGRDAIHRQFFRFILVGLSSTMLDGIAYSLALSLLPTSAAKGLGYLVGMSFSILCNYRWSFGYTGDDRARVLMNCVLLYALALLLNIAVNQAGIGIFGTGPYGRITAFLLAVGASTIFNFAGMRWWVFRQRAVRGDQNDVGQT